MDNEPEPTGLQLLVGDIAQLGAWAKPAEIFNERINTKKICKKREQILLVDEIGIILQI